MSDQWISADDVERWKQNKIVGEYLEAEVSRGGADEDSLKGKTRWYKHKWQSVCCRDRLQEQDGTRVTFRWHYDGD